MSAKAKSKELLDKDVFVIDEKIGKVLKSNWKRT
jgi:hypothetical protein